MEHAIVDSGEARAVIVPGGDGGEDGVFVAGELRRTIQAMTGAAVPIRGEIPGSGETVETVIVVGKHDDSLSADGFEIRTEDRHGRRTVFLSGGSARGVMYAGYEFLEQLGAVFRISGDIIPFVGPDLECPQLDLRREPAFTSRGLNYWGNHYTSCALWSLGDFQRCLDQMAKLKFNHLLWHWFDWDTGLDYSFRGERKLIGDLSSVESGYTFRRCLVNSYNTRDLEIGSDRFTYEWLAPPELQGCPSPEDALRISGEKLRAIQTHAKSRHIDVSFGFEPLVFAPNVGRHLKSLKPQPFQSLMGMYVCASDPATLEANEARLRALFERYPDTYSVCLWMSEGTIPCFCPSCQETYEKYLPHFAGAEKFFGYYEVTSPDSLRFDIAFLDILLKLKAFLDRFRPGTRVMISNVGREYIFPYYDKLVPPDVTFCALTSRGFAAREGVMMELFQTETGRDMWATGRHDDDGSTISLQFNVDLFRKDGFFAEGKKNGVTGQVFQFVRSRGSEHNVQYQAECCWDPDLTPQNFYDRYLTRVFGADVLPHVRTAYRLLEENEERVGYDGRYILPSYGYGWELKTLQMFRDETNPYEGPRFEKHMAGHVSWYWGQGAMPPTPQDAESSKHQMQGMMSLDISKQEYWERLMQWCRENMTLLPEAIGDLKDAEGCLAAALQESAGDAAEELRYLINKTRAGYTSLEAALALDKAYLAYEGAFATRADVSQEEFVAGLQKAEEHARHATWLARETTRTWADDAVAPEDLGGLFNLNKRFAFGYAQVEQFMKNIAAYHTGRPYWKQVDWDNLYPRMIG